MFEQGGGAMQMQSAFAAEEIDCERRHSACCKARAGSKCCSSILAAVLAHGAWSIPKGEIGAADAPEMVARPEFAEELGPRASMGRLAATSGGPTARREARYRIRRRGPF